MWTPYFAAQCNNGGFVVNKLQSLLRFSALIEDFLTIVALWRRAAATVRLQERPVFCCLWSGFFLLLILVGLDKRRFHPGMASHSTRTHSEDFWI
ncbi:hypothetical protein KOW79_004134 [Hemibagrus wyckioides]|uniref:Uncharacterized protein n=1 Tax=Hemibagrus wyckioides TaxID=337641 RepID=A0A9D3SR50_9TELE|nr:hypothetical protein KOW79_004134 [Hemibagrus wyckioides]